MIIPLTDSLIRESFDKTGLAEKYYSLFSKEAYRCYESLQKDMPDDEETTYDDSNVKECLIAATEYTSYYSQEIEKGHCEAWAQSFARDSVNGETKEHIIRSAMEILGSLDERNREIDIHVDSISDDAEYKQSYKDDFMDLLR